MRDEIARYGPLTSVGGLSAGLVIWFGSQIVDLGQAMVTELKSLNVRLVAVEIKLSSLTTEMVRHSELDGHAPVLNRLRDVERASEDLHGDDR